MNNDISEKLEDILTQALIHPDQASQMIGKALEVLRSERKIDEIQVSSATTRNTRNKPTKYRIRDRNGEQVLEEYRPNNPYPFRCPRIVYDALTGVLAGREEDFDFKDAMAAMTKEMGSKPAGYLLRICLRLWVRSDPPLLKKNRARYRLADPDQFRKHASFLWQKLAKEKI